MQYKQYNEIVKPGFHYPSSRPEFTGRQLGPWTRAVNSGSGTGL